MSTQTALFGESEPERKKPKIEEIVSHGFDVKQFVENFQTIVECLGGTAKVRQCVLDLAVRGRLLPPKRSVRVEDSPTALFEIPGDWRWITLGEVVVRSDYGTSQKAHKEPKGVAVLRMNNIQEGRLDLSSLKYVPVNTEKLAELALVDGDLLFNRTNSFELVGKMAVFRHSGQYTFASYLIRLRLDATVLPEYVNTYFGTAVCRETQIEPRITRQTNQANFNGTKLKEIILPLPPLAEQKRIVAKVDELMALIDALEAKQTKKREVGARLTKSALDALSSAEAPEEFDAAWKRVVENFDVLIDRAEKVAEVRATILDLAVRGCLTTHLATEESASTLRDRIMDRHNRNPVSSAGDQGGAPFELPRGWCWARLPELGELGRGKSKHRPRNDPALFRNGKFPMVQTGDVARARGEIVTHTALYGEAGLAQSRLWPRGTLCITIAANIADTGILGFDACFPDSVVGFLPDPELGNARYFEFFLRTAKQRIEDFAPATAQKNINLEILSQVLVPLPPKGEIVRIVAKVDSLMKLCDELEEKFRRAEERAAKLAEAAVRELVA